MEQTQALIRLEKIKEAVNNDIKPMVDYVAKYIRELSKTTTHIDMTLDFSERELQTGSIVIYEGKLWKLYVHDDGVRNFLPEFDKTAKVTLVEYTPTELTDKKN